MRPDVPVFDFGDTLPASIVLGVKTFPINVKRLIKTEFEEFLKTYNALLNIRGSWTDDSNDDRAREFIAFAEKSICDLITVDEGWIRDRGQWVTTGAGLIAIFHARPDVLGQFLREIFRQNTLSDTVRKNFNSPRASESGSVASIPARGGDGQGPIATDAEHSTTAESADVTDENRSGEVEAPESSGERERVPASV